MLLEPKDLLEKLEFDKILELTQNECYGELGKHQVMAIRPDLSKVVIERKLLQVEEYVQSLSSTERFPMSSYQDLSKDLRMLEVVDYVLPEEGLKRINQTLVVIKEVYHYFTSSRQELYPTLYDIIRPVMFDESLQKAIEKVIDEEGNIKPDASPELMKIRKAIISKNKEMDKQFRSIIATNRNKGWLTDNVESYRNGRRVLSVPSEHKRKIRGIIHDESTTGKTAFIEPEAIIDINNDIFDLETDEKREIYKILKELSAVLRPYVPVIRKYQKLMIQFDVIQAKARLARQFDGQRPVIKSKPHLGIRDAYHPLLLLKNKELQRNTIPFDLKLIGQNRLLMLSGPNAGGKSITMKSVGLLQLMVQSGMLIPAHPLSEFGIFEHIFADIGDQQSLEDDLSTYSSRLENMRKFLNGANEQTLILIDEFGSGTDPKIGGAIAEAILREFNFKKVFGVITTHYSNLKVFAFKAKGIVNGSMMFNKEALTPTYELKIGRPGSSYAYEIAEKSGLSNKILKYAKHKTGENEKAVDELLMDLQREKKEVEDQLVAMAEREKKLQRLIKNYENLHKDLEYKRKKLKLQEKESALQQTQRDNKDVERLIREIREEKNLEKAKELAMKVREEKAALSQNVVGLKDTIYAQDTKKTRKPIAVGDFVKLRSGGAAGKVESINKNKAIVMMGIMKMTVNIRDLAHANEPLPINKTKGIQTNTIASSAKFESKLDIRGLSREESLKVLETFVDKALMTNVNSLKIVHGKGNGVLRQAVLRKLREYKDISNVYHPPAESGGDGVTMVDIG